MNGDYEGLFKIERQRKSRKPKALLCDNCNHRMVNHHARPRFPQTQGYRKQQIKKCRECNCMMVVTYVIEDIRAKKVRYFGGQRVRRYNKNR